MFVGASAQDKYNYLARLGRFNRVDCYVHSFVAHGRQRPPKLALESLQLCAAFVERLTEGPRNHRGSPLSLRVLVILVAWKISIKHNRAGQSDPWEAMLLIRRLKFDMSWVCLPCSRLIDSFSDSALIASLCSHLAVAASPTPATQAAGLTTADDARNESENGSMA